MGAQAWLLLRCMVCCWECMASRPLDRVLSEDGAAGCWPAVCRAVGCSLWISLSLRETTQVHTANLLEQAASLAVYLESTQLFRCAGDRRDGGAWAGWAPHSPSGSVIARRATAIMGELAPRMTSHSFVFLSSRACHMPESCNSQQATRRMQLNACQAARRRRGYTSTRPLPLPIPLLAPSHSPPQPNSYSIP